MHVLGLGSSTFALPPECYRSWQKTFEWRKQYGVEYLHMGPLFIHHLSHCWLDFRGITDGFMQAKGLDYFENSRRAVRMQQSYAQENPQKFRGYRQLCWGVSASDGPGPERKTIENVDRDFWMYRARGLPEGPDDGTLAPGSVAASLPFAPELVVDTLRELVRTYPNLRSEYGLRASLNPTFGDWVSPLNYGLDQGPIVMMIENYRTGLLWNLVRRCPYIRRGLRQAGFAWRMARIGTRAAMSSGGRGAVARAGYALQQIVREPNRQRTIPGAFEVEHAGCENPLVRRSHGRKNRAGSPARAWARAGAGSREGSRCKPAGLDDRGR